MTRAAEPAYLGGIGLMLEVAHACPRCGRRLSATPLAATRHISEDGCRPMVYAALPDAEPVPEGDDLVRFSAGRQIHGFESPLRPSRPVGMLESKDDTPLAPPTARSFAVAWLRPPDLLEVP